MKTVLLFFLVLLQVAAPFANAAFYRWTDANGVVHFTDDPEKIPKKYQKRARELKLSEEPAPAEAVAPGLQAPPQLSKPQSPGPGGHTEQWWRERFAALRGELKALQGGLQEKQAKLAELRRKRAIYVRIKDREAVNAMQAEVSADEARISELLTQIGTLEQEAAKAEVPAEWLR
jgi:hypothetical protein